MEVSGEPQTPAALIPGKELPVTIKYEAGGPQIQSERLEKRKALDSAGTRTADSIAHSVVTLANTIFFLKGKDL
jgi:hypothetical protein